MPMSPGVDWFRSACTLKSASSFLPSWNSALKKAIPLYRMFVYLDVYTSTIHSVLIFGLGDSALPVPKKKKVLAGREARSCAAWWPYISFSVGIGIHHVRFFSMVGPQRATPPQSWCDGSIKIPPLFLNVCLVSFSIFPDSQFQIKILVDSHIRRSQEYESSLNFRLCTYHKKTIIRPVILLIYIRTYTRLAMPLMSLLFVLVVSGDTQIPFSLGAVVSTIANFVPFKSHARLYWWFFVCPSSIWKKFYYRVNDGTTPRGAFQSSRESRWWCRISDDMKWHF